MQGILISGSAIFLGIWNYQNIDNLVVSKLYRLKLEKEEAYEKMVPQGMRGPLDFICDRLPRRCKGCQNSRKARSFALGRQKLHKEINICEQIREQRYIKKSLKLLLSRKSRKHLLMQS